MCIKFQIDIFGDFYLTAVLKKIAFSTFEQRTNPLSEFHLLTY